MKRLIKSLLARIYLDELVSNLLSEYRRNRYFAIWRIKRNWAKVDNNIIDNYFADHEIRKLHIGCGHHILKGWLNSDYYPQSTQILHLDATKPFPFKDGEFDYVFSEHMIEHITYSEGLHMSAECRRVLKPNGTLRIATPNLSFLVALYQNDMKTDLQKDYIKWSTDQHIPSAPSYEAIFIINNFMRDWEHKFIYDEKTLRYSLENAGFAKIAKRNVNHSEDENLRNLENEGRMPAGFLEFESIILEATCLSDRND
jgi:predicted SAM-dependent methyltransferase